MFFDILFLKKKLLKFSRWIRVTCIFLTISLLPHQRAISRDVQATFAYCAVSGDVSFNCPILFATPEEVFSIYQKSLVSGLGAWMWATNLHGNLDSGTENGVPTYYAADYFQLDNNAPAGTGNVIWSVPRCPESNYPNMVYKTGNPSNILTITCQGEPVPDPDCEKCGAHAANPIYIATGTKFQKETDYSGAGSNELEFSRTYRSDQKGWTNSYQTYGVDFTALTPKSFVPCYYDLQRATNWLSCFRFAPSGLANDFMVQRSGHRALNFGTDTDLLGAVDVNDTVSKIFVDGVLIGFNVYRSSDESTERFDRTGRLQSVTSRNGRVKSFFYSDATAPGTIASSAGLLIRVADAYGHELHFTYDGNNRMATMTDPVGGITVYGYDEGTSFVQSGKFPPGNLTSVTYPDGKKRLYWYNEQDKTGGVNLPYALTGISDELGLRFATFTYDTGGRAISSEHAGGMEKFNFAYPSLWATSTVTDPLGTVRTYTFQTILGASKNTGISQPGPAGVGTVSTSMSYDSHGNVARSTDFNGVVTTFAYDLPRNLETSRVEAAGTPLARTITTEWHPTFRLPAKTAEPQRITTSTYDTAGNLLKRTVQATSDLTGALGLNASLVGTPHSVSYTYNSAGQVLMESGPRTDIASTTTYTYDGQGNLSTVTDAANHLTTYQNYDANGRVGRIVAANGITTDLAYWPRGWLKQRSTIAGGVVETTAYDYDAAGQLKMVTLPDHSTMRYDYDDAHRMVGVTDSTGNKVGYTYDLASNRITDQVTDPANVLTGKIARVYDALNLLKQQTGGTQ